MAKTDSSNRWQRPNGQIQGIIVYCSLKNGGIAIISPAVKKDLEINCGDIGIDKVKFSQMPAIIPVIIISDGDIITVNVSVKSEFKGHSYKSDNIILVSQGGYVSLMLAKTNIGYFVIGSNNRTDF